MSLQPNLQQRLALVIWGTAVLAFLIAGCGLLVFHRLTLEDRASKIMEPYAQMIAVGTDAAVAFQDPVRAQEILDSLENNKYISVAEIFLDTGSVLASYGANPQVEQKRWLDKPDGVYVGDKQVELMRTLPRGARLRLGMNMARLNEQTYQVLWLFGAGMLVLLVATYGQFVVLRRTIVRPITSLTRATELIRDKAEYTHRVPASGDDEIARLGYSFNAMMKVIQVRDENLRRLMTFHRTILNNAAHVIISATPDGTVSSFNPAAERMLGYSADEVVGRQTPALWHDKAEIVERARELSEELGEVVAPGFDVFSVRPKRNLPEEHEWTFVSRHGERIPVHLAVTALHDEEGRITGYVGFAYDLTERKRAEEELRRHKDDLEETVKQRTQELMIARDAAEAANKAKSVFLANMSHELRTPLNAILGFSSLVRRDTALSAYQRENLEIINRSGEHLLSLINDVLEIAKIEAGKVQLEMVPFDFGGMVRDVADMMRLRAIGKGLQLLLDMTSDCPRYINGDEPRMRQILINLVGNAVKFTETGMVTIRFGIRQQERMHMLMEIEDTGPGISEEDCKRLFEPFVQLAEGGEQKGTGLGLAITRQFVELMEGTISVESTEGKGSLFRVDLPIEPLDQSTIPFKEPVTPGEVVGLAPGQPVYRILIAEDQPENKLLLTQLMAVIGCEVSLADDGEQCVKRFLEWHPDLIWMDIRMPVLDGEEATRRIRQLPGGDKVKIVAVTASAFKEEQREMQRAGIDDFVRKPYRFGEIYDCLTRQLGLKYIYKATADEDVQPHVLIGSMLNALPAQLRHELHEVVASLESDRIAEVIDKVSTLDSDLGRTLRRLVDNFDYQAILDAMRKDEV